MADEALFDENLDGIVQPEQVRYDEENIRHMSDMDHIRNRPGMYIGKLGDGSPQLQPVFLCFGRRM